MDQREREGLSAALLRLQRGERAAADDVFRRAWPVVRAFAERWLAGSPQAEDAAQRALVRVFAQVLSFDATRDALTWVLEVTLWECRTERRRMQRLRRASAGDEERLEALAANAEGRPDVALEAVELRAALRSIIAALPEADRREVERLLLEEVSGDAAGRKRRQRAIERLRQLWRRLHGE